MDVRGQHPQEGPAEGPQEVHLVSLSGRLGPQGSTARGRGPESTALSGTAACPGRRREVLSGLNQQLPPLAKFNRVESS